MSASKSMYSSSEPKTQSAISYGSDRDRALSLSRTKISQLSQKLSNHQNSIDQDQFKKETYEQKIKVLEDKAVIRNNYKKFEEEAQNEKIIRKNGDEKLRTQDLKILKLNLGKELLSEKINRKDYEQKIIKTTDERVYSLRLDIARQKKYREEDVEEERRLRQEGNQQVIKILGDSILKLQEILTTEKKLRETAQSQMFRMFDEMNSYLNGELNAEKSEREATEESIINLIDQRCNRVENSLRK